MQIISIDEVDEIDTNGAVEGCVFLLMHPQMY
jgi:hypothetical protein